MEFYKPIDWTRHPLHAAAFSGNKSQVERLIADGADVSEQLNLTIDRCRQGVAGTPLHVAIRNCWDDPALYRGHHEVVSVLLAAGADVALCRKWEGTALHDAARFGLTHIAERLISHGADVNSKENFQQRTPLHFAAMSGEARMIDFLLSKGAEIDPIAELNPALRHAAIVLPDAVGNTPLHLAAREGHIKVVKRLIDAGASRDVDKAIDMAVRSKQDNDRRFDEVISLLSLSGP